MSGPPPGTSGARRARRRRRTWNGAGRRSRPAWPETRCGRTTRRCGLRVGRCVRFRARLRAGRGSCVSVCRVCERPRVASRSRVAGETWRVGARTARSPTRLVRRCPAMRRDGGSGRRPARRSPRGRPGPPWATRARSGKRFRATGPAQVGRPIGFAGLNRRAGSPWDPASRPGGRAGIRRGPRRRAGRRSPGRSSADRSA